jgi:hypothetical protein
MNSSANFTGGLTVETESGEVSAGGSGQSSGDKKDGDKKVSYLKTQNNTTGKIVNIIFGDAPDDANESTFTPVDNIPLSSFLNNISNLSPSAPKNAGFGEVFKKLCGDYKWKKVGDSYTAQIEGLYLEARPDPGSKNTDPLIYFTFSSSCITLPAYPKASNTNEKFNIDPTQATTIFNNAWNDAVNTVNGMLNAGTLRFQEPVRNEFLKQIRLNLQMYHFRAKFTPSDGCFGSIPISRAKFCNVIKF